MIKYSVARPEDGQKIRKLEQKIWKEKSITSPYEAVTFIRHGIVLIAKDGSKIVGAIVTIRTMKNEICVVDWIVNHNYRGMGIGEKLYKLLIKKSKRTIVTFVDVKNTEAIEIHKNLGFKKVRTIRNPYNISRTRNSRTNWDRSAFLMKRDVNRL